MGSAHWWANRRFGMMIDVSVATVPGWAPVGQQASWYRAHTDGTTRDLNLHPAPLVETLHHHRERWGHIERYDDFFPFLHFDAYDPDEWTALARDAGMSYAVMTAKHHDGWCWWDAPGTDRTVLHDGPARNVLGEFAAACERADLVLGAAYSLLDWSDPRYPSAEYVREVVHPQVLDLVERYGTQLVWGEGHWGAGGDHWRSDELHAAIKAIAPDALVNDHWWASNADVITRKHRVPTDIEPGRWEFRRPLGASAGFNRAEPVERLMSARDLVALLTEVVAKGGHLLLQVGPDAAGVIPEPVAERLRTAGGWIRRHRDLVDRGRPWSTWGDDDTRYLSVDDELWAVDVTGQGRFDALDHRCGKVVAIEADGRPVPFDQTDAGVRLERPPRRAQRMPAVYRVEVEPPPPTPIALFTTTASEPIELAPLLGGARPGTIVQLGDGRYLGPARVPDGVTVRGLGPARTVIDGDESTAVVLGADSRLEHCRATGGGRRIGRLPRVCVELPGDGSSIVGCDLDGHVSVSGSGVRITSCTLLGVVARRANRLEVLRSTLTGMGTDIGIDIEGGAGHLVDGCEIRGHLAAITLVGTVGASIRRAAIRCRWWGVRLLDTEATDVTANSFDSTMRAVDVDGGTDARITGNAVQDGDSGCVVQSGASNAEVAGNFWQRCRIGLMVWNAGDVRQRDNTCADLPTDGERVVVGP